MSLEEKVLKYKQIQNEIKRLETEKEIVYEEILHSFQQDEKELFSESFRVRKYVRLSIKTTVEEAKAFGATKVEELVDKDKIKEIIHSGVLVPNVTETNYFLVQKLNKKNDLLDENLSEI